MNTKTDGPRVFVSHANADGEYVRKFVDEILLRGAGLRSADVFYSSAPDMGVSSGELLMERVRTEASDSSLIISMVTPIYQTRSVCIAELGAAWARGVHFPMLAPGMDRSELEGVLPGLLIKAADEETVLDELAGRIKDLGFEFSPSSFGVGRANWLSEVRSGLRPALLPPAPSADELKRLEKKLENTENALDEAKEHLKKENERNDRLKAAKTKAEVRQADLPTDEHERFEALLKDVTAARHELSAVVIDSVWHYVAGQKKTMPEPFDALTEHSSISTEVKDGRLILDDDNGGVSPNLDFPQVERARKAIAELAGYLESDDRSETFSEWFEDRYGTPMDLRLGACWKALF